MAAKMYGARPDGPPASKGWLASVTPSSDWDGRDASREKIGALRKRLPQDGVSAAAASSSPSTHDRHLRLGVQPQVPEDGGQGLDLEGEAAIEGIGEYDGYVAEFLKERAKLDSNNDARLGLLDAKAQMAIVERREVEAKIKLQNTPSDTAPARWCTRDLRVVGVVGPENGNQLGEVVAGTLCGWKPHGEGAVFKTIHGYSQDAEEVPLAAPGGAIDNVSVQRVFVTSARNTTGMTVGVRIGQVKGPEFFPLEGMYAEGPDGECYHAVIPPKEERVSEMFFERPVYARVLPDGTPELLRRWPGLTEARIDELPWKRRSAEENPNEALLTLDNPVTMVAWARTYVMGTDDQGRRVPVLRRKPNERYYNPMKKSSSIREPNVVIPIEDYNTARELVLAHLRTKGTGMDVRRLLVTMHAIPDALTARQAPEPGKGLRMGLRFTYTFNDYTAEMTDGERNGIVTRANELMASLHGEEIDGAT